MSVLIRPEHTFLDTDRPASDLAIPGVLRSASYKGIGWRYEIDSEVGPLLAIEIAGRPRRAENGAPVYVGWRTENVFAMPAEAGLPAPRHPALSSSAVP